MCVITVKLHDVNMTIIFNYNPAMMFLNLQGGQERFYDSDWVTGGYFKFTCPQGLWAIIVFKGEDSMS